MNPIASLLASHPFIVLDGAFATELERLGFAINDPLWSAIALYKAPDLVKKVHHLYLDAGADIITSASYQATIPGFLAKGFSPDEAETLLRKSLVLAKEARDEYEGAHPGRRPLVAASIGPYGAYLADGSEYRGHYGKSREDLARFHRQRLAIIEKDHPDLYACETIPALVEAEALAGVLHEGVGRQGWIAFSCKDGKTTCGGDAVKDCAAFLDAVPEVIAIGVNCTAPEYVTSLIGEIRKGTDKPVVVYPNSGEVYDVKNKVWQGAPVPYEDYTHQWYQAGARLIGGCCRTTPETIRAIAAYRDSLEE